MTTVYRERDRYDDSRSVASTRRGGDDDTRTYTKVTRYIIRDDDDDDRRSQKTHHTQHTTRRDSPERERETQTVRITRRDVDDRETVVSNRRSNVPTYVERDMTIRGGRDNSRVSKAWEREEDTTDRELVVRRAEPRDDGRRETDRETLTVTKADDRRDSHRYDYDVYRSGEISRDKDLAHYSRTAEYYGPPMQPQTIIIRQDPIIIRERVRDDDYQIVRKSDVDDERSVARSVATTRRDEPRDEEYFYEKKVRERFDDRYDDNDRRSRRELSPGDSISQVGRGRDRDRDRDRDRGYSSDDSMVYVKRVEKGYSREGSRDNKKDLAAGVIAGVGAAELLRNHRKKEGKEASSGIGRIGRDIGAGAIGAIGAEAINRYRSKSRHRSRSRGRSEDSYDRGSRRSGSRRSRSRSGSHSRLKTLGALGLGAVAIAAAASAATRKADQSKQKEHRRSRSRRRKESRGGSVESMSDLENDPTADDARNPKKRNQRIAAAGAIGAAGAALIERARSKSRGREGSRERSRIKEGLPIAAAGLGTAALAGLYEKNKAKREAQSIQKEQRRRSRSRSTTRGGRSDSQYDDRSRSRSRAGEGNWGVEYGHGDVAGNNFGPEYYGRAPPPEPYYANEGAVVPAGRTRSRSRSASRDRRGMRAISPAHEGARGSVGEVGAAAGAAAAASEHERRKAEKRERKARRRAQDGESTGRDPYEDSYGPQQMQQPWTPPPANDPYANQQGFGNQYQSQFPPPPGSMPQGLPNQFQPQYQPHPAPSPQPPQGNFYQPPQNYPQPSFTPQPPHSAQVYPPPPSNSAPPPQGGYHDQYNAGGAAPYGQQPRNRGSPEDNVSAGPPFSQYAPPTNDQRPSDGVSNTRSVDPLMPSPHSHTPAVHVHPPGNSSTPSLNIPQTYIPPAERPDPSTNNDSNERRVQFAESPEMSRSEPDANSGHHRSDTMESDDISPDARRHRRRQHETNRGYEASDDTDLSPNSERRASKHNLNRDQSNDHSSQRRNSERSLHPDDPDNGRRRSVDSRQDKEKGRRPSRSEASSKGPMPSPTDSDTTIDLPARFDDAGKKRTGNGDDPIANRIDDILKGKGTAGKVFGNFLDGLMGPEARNRRGSDAGEGNSKRSRDKDRD